MPITKKEIQVKIEQFNKAMGSPLTYWDTGSPHANVGNYHLRHESGFTNLCRTTNKGGGIRVIRSFKNRRRLLDYLDGGKHACYNFVQIELQKEEGMKIEFSLENSFFKEEFSEDTNFSAIAETLRSLADKIGGEPEYIYDGIKIHDHNGNSIGEMRITK